ncbi:Malonyl CoA-acyl carrier protein transacylase [Granulicella sibirica]|uniref:Malonyl CoA-acyl carrier protein transacylase n=2 Tax=Granulicella sibirica TaxID=2479048 RepID=A0A4Q0T7V9_9BACT|nr:Malonyl CoA-acyl carrier protein transacylase [Granulicella sibirica]
MGRDLYDRFPTARAVFEEADDALGFALSKVIFDGPAEELNLTEHTQPAILTVSVAAYRVFAQSGITPAFAAGHSLGEYSAHVAAGTFTFAEAVKAVRNRGRFMQEAVPAGEGAMAAILGLPYAQINDICAQVMDEALEEPGVDITPSESHAERSIVAKAVVSPANLNSPDQTVISGAKAPVDRAIELCKEAGAKRTVLLQVSAPFHCKLMQPAQERLANHLESVSFHDPDFPIACNVDARLITRAPDTRDCLIRQVTGSVRWVECIQLLVAQGATHFVEVGPGKVLNGLMRQIDRSQKIANVEDAASLEKALAFLSQPVS